MAYDFSARENLAAMLRRATILEVDDAGSQQRVRLTALKGETFEKVYRAQPFGLSAVPPEGAEALLLALGGRSDRAVLIGGEHQAHRPTGLPPGAVALYGAAGELVSLVQRGVRVTGETVRVVASSRCIVECERTDLGGEGGSAVMTEAGPSTKVFAII